MPNSNKASRSAARATTSGGAVDMAGCYRTLALRPISQGEETANLNHHFAGRTRHMASLVTEPGFADVAVARAHFARRLQLETDCSDVYESMKQGADFILIDVRRPTLFAAGYIPGAITTPHLQSRQSGWPSILKTLFV